MANGKLIGKNITPTTPGVWDIADQYVYARRGIWPGGVFTSDGLVFNIDAGNSASYPGSGTTWYDLSGNSKTVTLYNGPTYSSSNGGIITFDGSNDYGRTPTVMFNPNADFTFECWFKWTSGLTLVSNNTASGAIQIRVYTNKINVLSSYVGGGGTFSGFTVAASTWYNIVITRVSNTYNLYVNGVYNSSFTSTTSYSSGPYSIGVNNSNSEWFAGSIPVVRAYQRVLSANEILNNFLVLRSRYGV